MGNVLASMAAYVASQERQNISRRTMAGLQAARSPGGWHPLVDRPEYSGFMRMSRCAPEDSPVFACAVRCVGPSTGTRGGRDTRRRGVSAGLLAAVGDVLDRSGNPVTGQPLGSSGPGRHYGVEG